MSLARTDLFDDDMFVEAKMYSRQIKSNPYTALLNEVQWRAGHVESLRAALAQQDESELFTTTAFGNREDSHLLKRYDKERRFLDKACDLAIKAGVSERYIRLAELQGQLIFQVLRNALDDPEVNLSVEQKELMITAMNRSLETSVSLDAIEANHR
jgi:hypothetical protein